MMKIYGQDNSELMQVTLLERDGNALVKGKVFGSMPMTAKLTLRKRGVMPSSS